MSRIALQRVTDPTADPAIQRNFDHLALTVPDFGDRGVSMRAGTVAIEWTGSDNFAQADVDHGLGARPEYAIATANDQSFTGMLAAMTVGQNDTTLTVRIATVDGSTPGAGVQTTTSWLVLG